MNLKDTLITLKAIEFMSYGIDTSSFTEEDYKGYVNSKTKKHIKRLSESVKDFVWHLDADSVSMLDLYMDHVIRIGKDFKIASVDNDDAGYLTGRDVNIVVSKDILLQTMRMLYANKVCRYDGVDETILDPELLERLEKIDKEFNRMAKPSAELSEPLSIKNIQHNFDVITAVAYSGDTYVRDRILDTYKHPYNKFEIESLKDYEVIDNRIYIGVNDADRYKIKQRLKASGNSDLNIDDFKYIVVSKNLYDYYFCSYGSDFQSCFSINGSNGGYYGALAFGTDKGHYIIYGTKDKAQKTSMTATGSKWSTPYMFFRCWGWLDENNEVLVDKPYTFNRNFYNAVEEVLLDKFFRCKVTDETPLKYASDYLALRHEHSLHYYADSISFDDLSFSYDGGDHRFSGESVTLGSGNLLRELQTINSITDSFNPYKDYVINSGRLCNPKHCPITNLLIDESESRSFYAKFLNAPVKEFAVVTWFEGYYKRDAMTSGDHHTDDFRFLEDRENTISNFEKNRMVLTDVFSCRPYMNLKGFKEFIKGHVKGSIYDVILLRVVENDKVTFIKYKKSGVQA